MSRFEETLQRDLRQIADRATPSSDAWASIQHRIADQDPIQETEIIMLTENTTTIRRWPLVAAAAGVVALAITGIALVNRGDGDPTPIDTPPPTVAPTTPQPVDETTLELPILSGSDVPAGRYSVDMLGVPFTFDVPDASPPWVQVFKSDVGFAIGADANTWVGAKRIGSFYDAEQAQDENMTGLGSIPPDGVDTWIEANGMIVDQSSESTVGGRVAQYRQVRIPLDAGDCDEGFRPCISAISSSADLQAVDPHPFVIHSERPWSFWIVDMGDFEPLWIAATTDQPDHQAWLDEVMPLIDSIALGEPAPAVEGGTARLSTFATSAEAVALPVEGADVDPGRYSTGQLGVPVAFEVPDVASTPWKMALNNAVAFMVGHGNNTFVAMERIGSFYDAEQAINPGITGLGSIPADDVDGWIAANGIIVEAREEVTVGGRVAQYRQIRIPADAGDQTCANPPCIAMVSSSADLDASPTFLFSELPHSFWFVDMGEFEPLGIWAYTAEPDHQAWLDELAPLIDSIVLGEPGPAVKNGTARVPLRVTVSAAYSGVRTDGAVLADGSIPVTYNATSEGTMTGQIVGTGTYVPGVETTGSDEYTFTGTIDGIGTGTLTYTDEWTATGPAESTITTTITGGTGDFVGVTGTGTSTVDTSDKVGADDTVTGTNAFDLVVPRSG